MPVCVDDAEVEAMDQSAVAALLAEIPHARAGPFAIGDDVVGDAFRHGSPHPFAISHGEMPVRNPISPDSATSAQRTPLACMMTPCMSSTLADMRASSLSTCATRCSSAASRSPVE